MNFIDHTGHIFTLPSYKTYPSGYEYDEQHYIFWLNESDKLSIKNYYIKPIRFILPSNFDFDSNVSLRISLDSQNYKLLGSYHINNLINNSKNIFDYITISSDNKYWDGKDYDTISNIEKQGYVKFDLIKDELTEDDVICLTNLITDDSNDTFSMVTFYVVGYSQEEQVLLTNILISLNNNGETEYCPITIGGEFMDECEPLVINGKNMGINLPKTIVRAFFDTSFYNNNADEVIYNNKIKELLLNYIGIKGECGNYDSAIKSLKWFGWGDKIKISKLLQTDNEFITQYIVDNFEITNDTLKSFQYFTNTTFIKLQIIGSTASDELNSQNINALYDIDNDDDNGFSWNDYSGNYITDIYDTFIGEGNPKIKDLINNVSEVTYDEGDIKFYKPYYTYLFQELGLKLATLEYFYRKYFLPIHLFIHSSSISYQCFMNHNKMIVGERKTVITAENVVGYDVNSKISVTLPEKNYIMFYTQPHIIDKQFNEFTKYIIKPDEYEIYWEDNDPNTELSNIYWNTRFSSANDIFNLYDLFWVNENCLSIPISFKQNTNNETEYYNCRLILEKVDKVLYDYEYIFNDILIEYEQINLLSCVNENDELANDSILLSHKLYEQDYQTQSLVQTDKWDEYKTYSQFKEYIKNKYFNFLLFGQELPKLNIKIKSQSKLSKLIFGKDDYIDLVKCELLDDVHTLIYESSFNFIQHKTYDVETNKYIYDSDTLYKNFVIIPKIINKKYNVNFWLNNEFNLYLNVNGQWFTYNFICKVPEFQMNLGKLDYKYYFDTSESYSAQHGDATLFKQLHKLTDKEIEFNLFMWEPDLVRVNNTDFFNNLLDYYKNYKYNITYNENVEGYIEVNNENAKIKLNDIYYTVNINNKKLYIHQDVIQKYFITQKHKYLKLNINDFKDYIFDTMVLYSTDLNDVQYCSIYNEENNKTEEIDTTLNDDKDPRYKGSSGSLNELSEGVENFLFTSEDSITYTFYGIESNKILNTNVLTNSENDFIVIYEDEYDTLEGYKYIMLFFELWDDYTIHFYVKDIYNNKVYLETLKSFFKNENELYNKYIENPNIVNNNKYLNKVHQYYIYKDNNEQLRYNPNNTSEAIKLYNRFFNQDEEISSKIIIPDCEYVYDFYLMHDNEYWYAIFITRLPIAKCNQTTLAITDERKEIIYTDYVDKIYSNSISETGDVVYDYYNINAEILSNVLIKTGLIEDDLLIVYNTVDNIFNNETSEYDNNINNDHILSDIVKNNKEHISHKYIINKIYNKNIGKFISNEYSNDPADICWNEEPNDNVNYIGVNWIGIPVENVICPQCGHTTYFTSLGNSMDEYGLSYVTSKCEYITGLDDMGNNTYCGYEIKLNTNSILRWNDRGIPYKLIYTITDDIYNEELNPNGLYHQQVEQSYDKYVFSMNNKHYYLLFNDDTNSYLISNIKNSNEYTISYTENLQRILDTQYNETSESYYGKLDMTDFEADRYSYIEIVEGLDKDTKYYTYLNNLVIYSKDIIENNDTTLDNFYILYDGQNVYDDTWHLEINKSTDTSNITDIINIYSVANDKKLQWVINPNYNYNSFNADNNQGQFIYRIDNGTNANYYVSITDEINNYKDKTVYVKLHCITNNTYIYPKATLTVGDDNNISKELTLDTIGFYKFVNGKYEMIKLYGYTIDNHDVFIYMNDIYWNVGRISNILGDNYVMSNECYKINTTDFIQFENNGKPKTLMYIDENMEFFILKSIHNGNKYEFYKQLIKRENIENNLVTESKIKPIYNPHIQQFFPQNYFEIQNNNKQYVIHHTKTWWQENVTRLGISEHNNDYDNLWYFISYETDINDKNKEGWQIVVYINEQINEPTEQWYYSLNGVEYLFKPKYSDGENVVYNIRPDDYANMDANNYVHINLNDYLNEPVKVDLSIIPGIDFDEIYYDKIDYYYFKYIKSDNKFLVNRMLFVPNEGKNHYNTDDIIVASISPKMDKNLPFNVEFKLDYGSHWVFKPMSLRMNKTAEVKSNTKMAIMSIGESNIRYERGYYDLIVNYSIDGNTQNIYEMKSRILVK